MMSVIDLKGLAELALELERSYAREYYKAHKEEAQAYYITNQKVIKERASKWKRDNRERYLKQQRDYDRNRRVSNYARSTPRGSRK